jgi:hypothetical protein
MPRTRSLTLAASVALLALATPLHAQRCLGFPGFGGQPLRLGGELTTGDNVTTFTGKLDFGQAAGTFGGVGIGVADYDRIDDSALLVSGNIGTQIPLGTASSTSAGAQLCPVAGLEFQAGPGDDISVLRLRGGVSLGTSIVMTPGVNFAPFGTLSVGYERFSFDDDDVDDDSEVGGILDLGAGLIFNNKFTIRPSVAIPLGFDDRDARFVLAVGFNFGGNRR